MKIFRVILALSMSLNLCLNANTPGFNIGVQSTNQYSVPTDLINHVLKLFSADLDSKGPAILKHAKNLGTEFNDDLIAKGSVAGATLISQISSNAGIMIAGLLVGSVGAYLTASSVGRAVDKTLDIDPEANGNDKVTYAKLFAKGALGLAIMTGTGLAVNAFLKLHLFLKTF
jgi:hypothetical protein